MRFLAFLVSLCLLPSAAPQKSDLCIGLDKKLCRNWRARRWLGCSWRQNACVAKSDSAISRQPKPLGKGDICSELNKRACSGRGREATQWISKHRRWLRSTCKFRRDKSLKSKTPDGKYILRAMIRTPHLSMQDS